METLEAHPKPEDGFAGMVISGVTYTERAKASKAILNKCGELSGEGVEEIGQYRGFALFLSYAASENEFRLALKGAMSYKIKLGGDASGNITRMDNALGKIPAWIDDERHDLQEVQQQLEATRAEFPKYGQFAHIFPSLLYSRYPPRFVV